MQSSRQGTKAYHIKTLVYDSGTFTGNKVNFMDALTFQSAYSVVPLRVHGPINGVRPHPVEKGTWYQILLLKIVYEFT